MTKTIFWKLYWKCNFYFILTEVPFVYMERAGFMTCTAASHQGRSKSLQLHFSGRVRHTRICEHHHCVCHATLFPSRAWTDGKTKDILTVFTFILKAKARDYGKGRYISDSCLRPITIHCASWPIRADCACWKEGLCRKSVWERRGIEDLQ